MKENTVKITYKIYLEAEDIKQSRIQSSTSFVENLFENCSNSYFHHVEIDNENDMDDFILRLYVDRTIQEKTCSAEQDAEDFIMDMAEFVDKIAEANAYMDMEGSFAIEYQGKKEGYSFTSEGGQNYCDFDAIVED